MLQKASILTAQTTVEGVQSITSDVGAQSITSTTLEENDEAKNQNGRNEKFNLGHKLVYLNKSLLK